MRILLISMPDQIFHGKMAGKTLPSAALSSLAGNIDGDHQVRVLDLVHRPRQARRILRETIRALNPDLVGLSCMTFQYDTARRAARLVREMAPRARIALGGYHATLLHEEIGDSPDGELFDFLICGEGEQTFKALVQALATGSELSGILGLSYRTEEGYRHNARREVVDLAEIRLPDRTVRLLGPKRSFRKMVDVVETSRGCYMNCSFCCVREMYGRSFRTYAVERVIRDIADARSHGAQSIFLVDDNITLDVRRFEEICNAIVAHGLNDVGYYVQASSVGLASSYGLVQKMARANFRAVYLGIENMSEKSLDFLRKGRIAEKSVQAIRYLQENGIRVFAGFIVGNPDDTAGDIRHHFKFAREMNVDFLGMQVLCPYPKTEVREELLREGMVVDPFNFRRYNTCDAVVRTRHLSAEELKRIITREYLRFTWHMVFHSKNLWYSPACSYKNLVVLLGLGWAFYTLATGKWVRSDFRGL